MSQMHDEARGVAGISVYSACVECSRCKTMTACVVLQADDSYYRQAYCKALCWKMLTLAIEANEELPR
jgi:hypothetical protein